MDVMDLQDAHELSFHPASSSLSPAILLSFPPEILSHVFHFCSSDSYIESKATFARLCRINKQFLPIAREHLYRELHFLAHVHTRLSPRRYDDHDLVVHIKRNKQDASLVKELFFHNPPELSFVEGLSWITPLASSATKVQKIWVLELPPTPRFVPDQDWNGTEDFAARGGCYDWTDHEDSDDETEGDGRSSNEDESGGEGEPDGEAESVSSGNPSSDGEDSQSSEALTNQTEGDSGSEIETNESTEEESGSEEEGSESEEDPEEMPDEEAVSKLCESLARYRLKQLTVLVLPHLLLNGADTFNLFTALTKLAVYKGSLTAPPTSDSSSNPITATLTRLWITSFNQPLDLEFVLSSSQHTLRFLHVSLRPENESISLATFSQLKTLHITALPPIVQLALPMTHNTIILAELTPKESAYHLLANIVDTLKTTKDLPNLTSYAFITDRYQKDWDSSIAKQFSNLPPSIIEIGVGPVNVFPFLPSVIGSHIAHLPSLRRIRLVQLTSSCNDPICGTHSPSDWISADVFKVVGGVQLVEVHKMSRRSWKVWESKQFYPQGKGKEIEPSRDYRDLSESIPAGEVCVIA